MAKGGDGKVSNSLVAASCAAILAVYTAGYSRTREAAEQFETQAQQRRPASRSERTAAVAQPQGIPAEPGSAAQQVRESETSSVRPITPAPAASVATERTPQVVETPIATSAPAPTETTVTAAPVTVVPAATTAPSAPASAPEPPPAPPPAPKWKDGTFTGWGTSRHGDIEARVVIHEGRIVEAGVSQCLTRYSCDVIDGIIRQPVQRQSPDVDYVSRSTESSDAYYFALVDALNKALPNASSAQ